MQSVEGASTQQKAFELNMDPGFYGTFAEIGAGQEVARWFFRAGGAAGTIAKTMSAYDMVFSDHIYGAEERYVSRARLRKMLVREFGLLRERLAAARGDGTRFFVLANTVTARGYRTYHDCHGWMGVRVQSRPGGAPNDILLHVRMLDRENVGQQEALGILGVNLLHAARNQAGLPGGMLDRLLDGLTRERIEIDVLLFEGSDFEGVDNRLVNLELVERNLANAVIFAPGGVVRHPSEMFYKRPLVLERGRFRPATNVNLRMMECAREQYLRDTGQDAAGLVEIMEISIRNLLKDVGPDHQPDFLASLDILDRLGKTVLVSNYGEFHRLGEYLRRYSRCETGLVLGVALLRELFDESYYKDLPGGILEAFGRLFNNDLRLYVYPAVDEDGRVLSAGNLQVARHLRLLYRHLLENGLIRPLDTPTPKPLGLSSAGLAGRIARNDPGWEERVTPEIAALIKEKGYFGYGG